jgi:hypothetical protein
MFHLAHKRSSVATFTDEPIPRPNRLLSNDNDGTERISTQTVFDVLEVPHRSRTAGACRHLAKIMRDLGWHPIKARGLTPGGFRDQVRGYARDKTGSALM